MSVSAMDKIMSPASMAVIGASSREHTIGFDIMKNLQKYGYSGTIYPINPKDSEIQGLKSLSIRFGCSRPYRYGRYRY